MHFSTEGTDKINSRIPCYKCTDRNSECHSICSRYSEWKEQHEKELLEQRKANEDPAGNYLASAATKEKYSR